MIAIIEQILGKSETYNKPDEIYEKRYDLPIEETEQAELEEECMEKMKLIQDIYHHADKGDASNVLLAADDIEKMMDKIAATGEIVIQGESGAVVVYAIHSDAGMGGQKFIYDGSDMYILCSNCD